MASREQYSYKQKGRHTANSGLENNSTNRTWGPTIKHYEVYFSIESTNWWSGGTYCFITELGVLPTELQLGFKTSPVKETNWANTDWAWNIHSLKHISILGVWGSTETCQCPALVPCPSFKKSCHIDYKLTLQIHRCHAVKQFRMEFIHLWALPQGRGPVPLATSVCPACKLYLFLQP